LALVGVGTGLRRNRRVTAWLMALGFAVVAAPAATIGDPRFHDPLVPLVAILAGVALAWLWHAPARLRRRRDGAGDDDPSRVRLPPSGGGGSTSTAFGGGSA
jgi:hypothetical protein